MNPFARIWDRFLTALRHGCYRKLQRDAPIRDVELTFRFDGGTIKLRPCGLCGFLRGAETVRCGWCGATNEK